MVPGPITLSSGSVGPEEAPGVNPGPVLDEQGGFVWVTLCSLFCPKPDQGPRNYRAYARPTHPELGHNSYSEDFPTSKLQGAISDEILTFRSDGHSYDYLGLYELS